LSVPVQVIACRTVSEITYNVSSRTLNVTHSLSHSVTHCLCTVVMRWLMCCVDVLWTTSLKTCPLSGRLRSESAMTSR